VRLTKDEARELSEQLSGLVDTWRDRNKGSQNDGRRTYHVFQIVQPFPEATPPSD
jgi:hypothetical protein